MTEFALILAGVNAVLTAAPDVVAVAEKVKQTINRLFTAGVISADEQNRLHAHCDDHMNARLRGEKPPELEIEPD